MAPEASYVGTTCRYNYLLVLVNILYSVHYVGTIGALPWPTGPSQARAVWAFLRSPPLYFSAGFLEIKALKLTRFPVETSCAHQCGQERRSGLSSGSKSVN